MAYSRDESSSESKGTTSVRIQSKSKFEVILAVVFIFALGQVTRYENRNAASIPLWFSFGLKLLLSVNIAIYGVKKGSLDIAGASLALVIGTIHCIASCANAFSLIAFFVVGSQASKWKLSIKQKFEPINDSGPKRNWRQVFCNGIVSSISSLVYVFSGSSSRYSSLITIASISCCCGDTLASELGSAMDTTPKLITTFKRVPPGTNGGISMSGTLASLLGGLFIGLVYYVTQLWTLTDLHMSPLLVITTGVIGGLFGSILDSLLGATLQYSGQNIETGRICHSPHQPNVKHISGRNVLSNNSVNLLSSLIIGIITPYILLNILQLQ